MLYAGRGCRYSCCVSLGGLTKRDVVRLKGALKSENTKYPADRLPPWACCYFSCQVLSSCSQIWNEAVIYLAATDFAKVWKAQSLFRLQRKKQWFVCRSCGLSIEKDKKVCVAPENDVFGCAPCFPWRCSQLKVSFANQTEQSVSYFQSSLPDFI